MATEAIFYADILGFSELPMSAAITALEDLGTALQSHHWEGRDRPGWTGRYGLGDCIFLTHADPAWALSEAAELITNVAMLTRASDFPVLLRGAIAYGEVQHLASVFTPERREAVNLAGQAVVEAVRLAEAPRPGGSKPKGPRLWITPSYESEIRTRAPHLADWLLTESDDEPTEVLWLLPVAPERFAGEEEFIKDLCHSAFTLLGKHGNAPQYGTHYVEFARLVVRALQRVKSFEAQGVAVTVQPLQSFAPLAEVREALAAAGDLPDAVRPRTGDSDPHLALVLGTGSAGSYPARIRLDGRAERSEPERAPSARIHNRTTACPLRRSLPRQQNSCRCPTTRRSGRRDP